MKEKMEKVQIRTWNVLSESEESIIGVPVEEEWIDTFLFREIQARILILSKNFFRKNFDTLRELFWEEWKIFFRTLKYHSFDDFVDGFFFLFCSLLTKERERKRVCHPWQ